MEVEGTPARWIGDGQTALLEAVRQLVGPGPLVAVTLDLHANLAPDVVALSDLITAYRTAPHRDLEETQERGAALLVDCLRRGIRPVSHLVKLPLLVTGEAAVTEVEPARSLFGRLPEVDRLPGVLTSSILIGCAWTDSRHTCVSVAVSGSDGEAVRRAAEGLAGEIWEARSRFAIDSPTASIDEAIALAYASPARPVFVSDSGDNPTAGAVGDIPIFLERLVELGASDTLVAGIADPEAVRRCAEAGAGNEVTLSLGGKLDRVNASPYPARAVVVRLMPQTGEMPPQALVRVGNVHVVLQSDRRPFTELRHFTYMGLDPKDYKLIIVKLGYLFPELRDFAPAHIMALSPGFADQRLDRLPFRHLARPIYPLDPDTEWGGAA
jgi:microcystin degradation protein MlrC